MNTNITPMNCNITPMNTNITPMNTNITPMNCNITPMNIPLFKTPEGVVVGFQNFACAPKSQQ